MNNYDRLGRVYLSLKEYQKAALYFTKGLEIASNLDYRIDYFNDLIQKAESTSQ